MDREFTKFSEWTFITKTEPPKDLQNNLIENEYIIACYKTIRDYAVFTNKRLLIRDKQGITGVKVETFTLPYKSIRMYSIENAGIGDLNSEVEIWTSIGQIKINLNRKANIYEIDKIIASHIL